MKRQHIARGRLCAFAWPLCLALAACSSPPQARPVPPPPAPPPVAYAEPAPIRHHESVASSPDGYKRDAAEQIYRMNAEHVFLGVPPPILRSVVVLQVRVDSQGNPVHVAVFRSNGFKDLEAEAINSVHRAAPLPVPNAVLTRGGHLEYLESWLFRDDGRFQIRSVAEVQEQ